MVELHTEVSDETHECVRCLAEQGDVLGNLELSMESLFDHGVIYMCKRHQGSAGTEMLQDLQADPDFFDLIRSHIGGQAERPGPDRGPAR